MTWEMLGEIHAPGRTLFLRAPVADGDRWVISALEATGRMPAGVGVVFASDDGGRTWHEVAAFDSSVEGPYDGTVDQRPPGFRDLIAVGDGFLAVGGTGNGSAPVWYGTWTQRSEE